MKIKQKLVITTWVLLVSSISGFSFYPLPLFDCAEFAEQSFRHEFVKRVNNEKEMKLGNYVVVEKFLVEMDAKKKVEEFRKMGFQNIEYGYLTNKNAWFVHFGAMGEDVVIDKRNEYAKMDKFNEVWLITVHE